MYRGKSWPWSPPEAGKPYDIVGFSLLYELNFSNILTILDLSGIPFLSRDRNKSHPFVISGGPCTFNPEPLADFFDAMVIGDGEDVFVDLAEAWLAWKDAGGDRQGLLEKWSQLQGVYVPSFFEAHWNADGLQVLTPKYSGYTGVRKALVSDLNMSPYPNHPVVGFGKPILSEPSCRSTPFCQSVR